MILIVKSRGDSVGNLMRLTRAIMWHTAHKNVSDAKEIVMHPSFRVRIENELDKVTQSLRDCDADWELVDESALARESRLIALGHGDPIPMLELAMDCGFHIGGDLRSHVRFLYSIMTEEQLARAAAAIDWGK